MFPALLSYLYLLYYGLSLSGLLSGGRENSVDASEVGSPCRKSIRGEGNSLPDGNISLL